MLGWVEFVEVLYLQGVDEGILVGVGGRNVLGAKVGSGPAALVVEVPLHFAAGQWRLVNS